MKMHRFILIIALLCFVLPLPARTAKLYRVGFLSPGGFGSGTNPGRLSEEIARHLAESGFADGANLELIKRGAEGHVERLPVKRPSRLPPPPYASDGGRLALWVRIPTKSAVDSERSRPPVPIEAGQGFR